MSGPSILHPAPYVPSQALAFADVDGTALLVSKSLALPVCVQNSAPITVSGNVAIANQAGGVIAISAASLPLPASAATAANQAAILSALQGATPAGGNLIGKVSTTFTASGLSPVTGSVSAGAQFQPDPGAHRQRHQCRPGGAPVYRRCHLVSGSGAGHRGQPAQQLCLAGG